MTPLDRAPSKLARGRDVWLKREELHELGAFKWRAALPVIQRYASAGATAVVTASTGNHGAATAWACREYGVTAIVYAPEDASATKLALLANLGAEVRRIAGDLDAAKERGQADAESEDLPFFEDGAEPLQYEAYGAIAAEIVEQLPAPPASVVVPVGNGALAGGIGHVLGERAPGCLRVAVAASQAPVMADSYDAGEPVAARSANTIADGMAVRVAIPYAVERLAAAVDRFVRVTERELAVATKECFEAGLRVEAAAAAPIAALPQLDVDGPIVCIVTGRNIDDELLERIRTQPETF